MGMSGGSSNQSSNSYGYNQSMAQSAQSVWGKQAPFLEQLYAGAGAAAKNGTGMKQANSLMNSAQAQLGAAGAQMGQAGAGFGAAMGAAKTGFNQMQQFANPNNALAQQQLAQMSQQIGQQFGREVLPQIRSGAGIGGNMGGSREALAKGVAAGDASRAIAGAGTDLYSNAYNTAAQMRMAMPGAAANMAGIAGGMADLGAMRGQLGGAFQGLAGARANLGFLPWQNMAGILGGPAMMSSSMARSQGENLAQSQGQSRQFGFNLW